MRKGILFLIFALVISVLALSGCNQDNDSSKQEKSGMRTDSPCAVDKYKYKEGVYPMNRWEASMPENSDGTITDSITEETAISIACIEFEKIQQTGIGKDYVLRDVFYDTEDQVWVVYFSAEPLVPGDCFNIAISKNTGKVLNMWPGE